LSPVDLGETRRVGYSIPWYPWKGWGEKTELWVKYICFGEVSVNIQEQQ